MRWSGIVRCLALLVCLLLHPGDAAAQLWSAAMWSQTFDASARSRALGETGLLLRGMPGAAIHNPAAIGRRGQLQVRYEGASLALVDGSYRFTDVAADYATTRWAVAGQLHHFRSPETEWRGAANMPQDTIRAYEMSLQLAGAYHISDDLSLGLGVRFLRSDLSGGVRRIEEQELRPANALAFDFGLHYQRAFGNDEVTVRPLAAWSLTNVGGTLSYVEDESGDPLPTLMRAGLGAEVSLWRRWLNRPLLRFGLYGAASKAIVAWDEEEGEAYNSVEALVHAWKPVDVWMAEGDERRLDAWDQLRWHRGIEASLFDVVSLRLGYFMENAVGGARDYTTVGWGIDLYYVAYEVATSYDVWCPDSMWSEGCIDWTSSTLTARVPLGGEAEGNFWPDLLDELGW